MQRGRGKLRALGLNPVCLGLDLTARNARFRRGAATGPRASDILPMTLPPLPTPTARCTRRRLLIAIALACCSTLLPALATAAKPKRPRPASVAEGPWPLPPPLVLTRFTLANGVRVVVHTDTTAPLVALGVLVDVGARDEQKGQTGLAHFFEHMMFQGSKRAAKMEHLTRLEAVGADLNAHTSSDFTYFYETVPRHALELALWLESDRFARLDLRPDNVENQRAAVLEERRERYENRPYAMAELELPRLAFQNAAFSHAVIGRVDDLQKAPIDAFQRFYDAWYAPANLVLVLSGDVSGNEGRALAERHLGRLVSRNLPTRNDFREPAATGHVYASLEEKLGKTPAFKLAWRVPPVTHPDAFVLDVLAQALGGGEASRLEKRLVRERALATSYWAGTHGRRDVDLLEVHVELAEPGAAALAEAKKRVRGALHEIAIAGLPDEELRRAKVAFESSFVFGALDAGRRAELLALHEVCFGDAGRLADALSRYRAVTSADVQRVVQALLTWDAEIELDLLPTDLPQPKGAGLKPEAVTQHEAGLAMALVKAEGEARRRAEQEQAALRKAAAATPAPASPPPEPAPASTSALPAVDAPGAATGTQVQP